MPRSVLDAIRDGDWDYEPDKVPAEDFDSTVALPGSDEKLTVLAERIADGVPLWHPSDRQTYDDADRD